MKFHTPNHPKFISISPAHSKASKHEDYSALVNSKASKHEDYSALVNSKASKNENYSALVNSKASKNENYSALVNSKACYDHLKESVSTRQPSTIRSSSNLYAAKLESKILQLQKKIDTQRYQIDLLTVETQQYTQICEKQKYELSSLNIQTLRGQYEQQIGELLTEKQKITELIYNLNEQYRLQQLEQENDLNIIKESNTVLTMDIERALGQKQRLLREIAKLDEMHHCNDQILVQQEQRIDELRNIERKLFIALKEMEVIEAKK